MWQNFLFLLANYILLLFIVYCFFLFESYSSKMHEKESTVNGKGLPELAERGL